MLCGLSWWLSGKESTCIAGDCLQCRWPRFNPWVRKIPWRRKWQPTPVFLLGKSHGQKRLPGYRPWGHKSWTPMSNWTTTSIIQPAWDKRLKKRYINKLVRRSEPRTWVVGFMDQPTAEGALLRFSNPKRAQWWGDACVWSWCHPRPSKNTCGDRKSYFSECDLLLGALSFYTLCALLVSVSAVLSSCYLCSGVLWSSSSCNF